MCYQEKWEEDKFFIRNPNGEWRERTPMLADIFTAVLNRELDLAEALNLAYELGQNSK